MWSAVKQWVAKYYAYQARQHYKRQRFGLCLHYLSNLDHWDDRYLKQPIFAGYLAMCHYQLKHWDNLTQEVERALFLLRRHINHSKEALVLWQELKSHLADLRYIDHSIQPTKKASTL